MRERGRFKDFDWNLLGANENGNYSPETIKMSLLMDIRDEMKLAVRELQAINRIIGCSNFIGIPSTLRGISRKIAKPRKKK